MTNNACIAAGKQLLDTAPDTDPSETSQRNMTKKTRKKYKQQNKPTGDKTPKHAKQMTRNNSINDKHRRKNNNQK